MPNLRIIHDNAADRAALVVSTTAGALAASNMLTEEKSQVHRSTGTSVTYTLTWAATESIGGVALPATNLTADATIRVRAYDATSGGTLVADTGAVYACPGQVLGLWDWTMPLNANAFVFGGASKTSVWLDEHVPAKRVVIDLVDTNNAAGYIDCARLVVGAYWEPTRNARWGPEQDVIDLSKVSRNDAGGLKAERAPLYDTLKFDFSRMPDQDRARLMMLMRQVGTSRNFFVSLLPQHSNPVLEQQMQMYGRRPPAGGLRYEALNAHTSSIYIESW